MRIVVMDTLKNIIIDPVFQSLCPSSSKVQLEQLKKSISEEGVRDNVVVWRSENTLLDGHTRLKLVEELRASGEKVDDPKVAYLDFNDRDKASRWIITNQLSRRNLNKQQASYLRGRYYLDQKQQGKRTDRTGDSTSGQNGQKLTTAERIGGALGVSGRTIRRDADFVNTVDSLAENSGLSTQDVLGIASEAGTPVVVDVSKKPVKAQRDLLRALATANSNSTSSRRRSKQLKNTRTKPAASHGRKTSIPSTTSAPTTPAVRAMELATELDTLLVSSISSPTDLQQLTPLRATVDRLRELINPESSLPVAFNGFDRVVLPDGNPFFIGHLPDELIPDERVFESMWKLRPKDFHEITVHGKKTKTPRWQQAFVNDYEFSGTKNVALELPSQFELVVNWAKSQVDPRLTGVLANWYDPALKHYIGGHHDKIGGLVEWSPIVMISFGGDRVFELTHVLCSKKDFVCTNGSVFILPWITNLSWKHGIPKRAKYDKRRISVTIRAFAEQENSHES